MKKTILRIVCCSLIIILAFGISCLFGKGIPPNADKNDEQLEPAPEPPTPHSHVFGDWDLNIEPTCTEAGKQQRTCSCGAFESRDVPALGHSYGEWTTTIEPTCETEGAKAKTCSRCSNLQVESIPPTGHSYGEWTTIIKPTCTQTGTDERACECGHVEAKDVEALGHMEKREILSNSTCSKEGQAKIVCERCGELLRTETIPKAKHTSASRTITSATCTESGTGEYYCTVCKQSLERYSIRALGHEYSYGMCIRCGRDDPSIYALTVSMKSKSGEYVIEWNGKVNYVKLLWQAGSGTGSMTGSGTARMIATFTRNGESFTIGDQNKDVMLGAYHTVSSITMSLSSKYSNFFINGKYKVQFRIVSNGNTYWSKAFEFDYNRDKAYWFTLSAT